MDTITKDSPSLKSVSSFSFSNIIEENNQRIANIKNEYAKPITGKIRNMIGAGLVLGSLFMVGFVALQIITGVLALVFSAFMLIGAYFGIRALRAADPLIKQKTQNYILGKMIEEAKTKKTETLTNLVLKSGERLEAARVARDNMGGYVKTLQNRLQQSDKNSSMYPQKVQMTANVERAYETIVENVKKATTAHRLLSQKVDDYKDMDEFSDIAAMALRFASNNGLSQLDEMLGMEAFRAIESEFCTAMSAIENSVVDYQLDNEPV